MTAALRSALAPPEGWTVNLTCADTPVTGAPDESTSCTISGANGEPTAVDCDRTPPVPSTTPQEGELVFVRVNVVLLEALVS